VLPPSSDLDHSQQKRSFVSAHTSRTDISSFSSSIFDDPFSPFASRNDGADLCLDIEMLRHADLRASRIVRLGKTTGVVPREYVRGSKGLKERIELLRRGKIGLLTTGDKGKVKEDMERVEVERQADLRLYLDDRCSRTREWFEKTFCLEKVSSTAPRMPQPFFASIEFPFVKRRAG
jgi:hypothetical protein